MERRHKWKMAGMELKETWRRAQDLDGRRHGACGDGNAGGGGTTRGGRKGRGVGRATNDEDWLGLGRARRRLGDARWQLEQGVHGATIEW